MSAPGRAGFFARRWRGEVAAATLFWRDMVAVGTVINLLLSFVALMLVALGASTAVGVAVHFVPLPYNLFLAVSLWRLPGRPQALALLAALWLALVTIV